VAACEDVACEAVACAGATCEAVACEDIACDCACWVEPPPIAEAAGDAVILCSIGACCLKAAAGRARPCGCSCRGAKLPPATIDGGRGGHGCPPFGPADGWGFNPSAALSVNFFWMETSNPIDSSNPARIVFALSRRSIAIY
jgi:hypothetical protein